jgi:3-phosphoshikimate 1-carboxyvinyltransferase
VKKQGILNVRPIQSFKGCIHLPASKSYSIRAHIIAACGGASQIKQASNCEDAIVAASVAEKIKNRDSALFQKKGAVPIFNVGESGTTLRFLLPLLALHTKQAKVVGQGTLIGRPNAHLCATLRKQGMNIHGEGEKESVPIVYKGGSLAGGRMLIDGSLSSQFISALLIALPSLAVDSHVILTGGQLVSQDYIQMTIQILAKAGIKIKKVSAREYLIKGGQVFRGLKNFYVPSDYGLAAFPMAAAALLPSNVILRGNLKDELVQSDGHILGFLKKMGVRYDKTTKAIKIKGPFQLKGGTFSLKNCPDLVPIMAVLALFAKGQTRLVDIHHARAKESDRISDLRKELLKVGAQVSETKEALIIDPMATYKSGQILDSHQDHRLAMAFTVLGLKIGCRVNGIKSSHKSYPAFTKDMHLLGARF